MSGLVGWMMMRPMRPVSLSPMLLPGGAGVGGLVDAVAHHVAVADRPRFAGAGPHDARIRRRDRERADRLHRLLVEDRREGPRAVGGLPDAARRGADVVGRRVARGAGDGRDPACGLGPTYWKRSGGTAGPAPSPPPRPRCAHRSEGEKAAMIASVRVARYRCGRAAKVRDGI